MAERRHNSWAKAQGVAGIHDSHRRGRGTSPQWKEHFTKVSDKWGAMATGQKFNSPWEEIRRQREKGGYPWTHLQHDQDGEVWLDPLSLPKDITVATLRRKDRSIPREWFHLPEGAETPTVEQLMHDSSSEEEDAPPDVVVRARSPPICGRSRSKSRERKSHKKSASHCHDVQRDLGGYEPISAPRRALSAAPPTVASPTPTTSTIPPTPPPKPLRKPVPSQEQHLLKVDPHSTEDDEDDSAAKSCFPRSTRSRSKSKDRSKTESTEKKKEPEYAKIEKSPKVNPKKNNSVLAATIAPPVDRSSKPTFVSSNRDQDEGGYEPVGLARLEDENEKVKIYEDLVDHVVIQNGDDQADENHEEDRRIQEKEKIDSEQRLNEKREKKLRDEEERRKIEMEEKEKKMKEKKQKEKDEKERKQREKEEKEKEEKERKQREKEEKEKKDREEKERKQREKEVKEKKEREEKERKQKEKEEKDKKEREEKERKQKEKEEKEMKERDEKEKKHREKEEKEKKEREEKEKKHREREEKEKKEREEKEKKHREKEEKEKKEREEKEKKYREKEEREKKEREEKEKKQKDKEEKESKECEEKEKKHRVKEEKEKKEREERERKQKEKEKVERENKERRQKDKEIEGKEWKQNEGEESEKKSREKKKETDENDRNEKEQKNERREDNLEGENRVEKSNQPLKTMNQANEFQNGGNQDEHYEDEVDATRQDAEEKKTGWAIWKIFDKDSSKIPETKKEDITTNDDGLLQPADAEPAVDSAAKTGNKLTRHEKRSFFYFLKKKTKSKSLSDLNADTPVPVAEEPGDFEEIQFSSKEKSSEGAPLSNSEALYEPVGTKEEPAPVDSPTPVSDQVFLTQPEEEASRSDSAMAAAVSHRGQRSPDHVEGFDDFARFQSGLGQHPGKDEYNYDEEDDDDVNFEPQNGYEDDEDEDDEDQLEYDEDAVQVSAKKKERKPREPFRFPRVDMKTKLASMSEKVKKARMPSPHELRDGYLNSSFHKSFQQPLAVRTREMDDPEELEHRQELVKTRTPSQLAQINTLSDIPLPSTLKNLISPSEKSKKSEKKKSMEFDPDAQKAWGLYGTLPRSMRETKLMTNCREMLDEDQLKQRQDLVQTKSPVELSEIRGLSDFPVPTKLENIFKKSRSRSSSISKEKRTRSESLPRSLGATMYGTLPKSWRERNLVTQVKVEQDPEVLEKRRALTESKTPAELAQISSIADLPIPTALEKFLKSEKKQKTEVDSAPSESSVNLSRFRNLESMYDSLPRSLKTELLVSTKVIQDEDELKRRQLLVESKKPLELSQIQTLSDFPMPSAIENIFKTLESKKSDDTDDGQTTKRKRNLTTGAIFSYDALPESLKTDLLVRTKVEMDPETQKQRQELVQTKTPAELSQIRGLEDFPLPQRLDTLVRGSKRHLKSTKEKEGITKDAKSKSWSSLPSKSELYDALPESLKTEVLVRSRVETPEIQHERAETVKSKTVAELSQINSLSEFPVPKPLEKLLSSENISKMFDRPGSEAGSENKSFGENLYDTLPRSMKSQVLVRVRDEDPDIQRARQELVRSKSPTELSQISSLSDFPVPATIENLMKRKSPEPPKDSDEPVAPPRRFKKENLYESLPESLKTEVLVRTKVEVDEKVLKERQELCRSKSPAELSEIHDISEFPIPTFVENLGKKSFRKEKIKSTDGDTSQEVESGQEKRTFYDTLPASLKAECLVRSRVEDPEKQRARAETVRSKSVHELSRITSVSDIPIPATIENLMTRVPRPVERKKRFREKQRSLSAKNLQERMYDTLPKSLKSEVLVKSKFEDPEIIEQRKKVTQSKSVNELSQIHSLSDFPIPSTIEKLMFRAKSEPATEESSKCQTPRPVTPSHFAENIYASLPRSLKSEVLVRTRVESPEILRERQKVTQSKSVSELSQMKSISDFPIPTTIENLIHQARGLKEAKVEMSEESSHPPRSHSGDRGTHDIYASLPRSLKQEVMVRTKIEQDEELVRKRQALIESKTPVELSKINSFSEIPLPKRIEDWLHTSEQQTTGRTSSPMQARSFHELSSSMYETLPRSLKEPTLVRSKIEDPEIQKERCELTRTKTPSQLAEMHTLSDIPIPGLWERGRSPRRSSEKGERSISIPRNTQEIKEIVYTKVLPESLTKPCVVRCKVEDPQILIRRQQLQQSKSIHELSKIRNLNEFPLPGNLKLPDIPLPSAKKLLRVLARTPAPRKSTAPHTEIPQLVEISPSSTPRTQERTYTDDEMLRFDAGSPDDSSMAVREQDFGYEVIEQQQQELQLLQQLEVERVEEKFFDQSIPHDVTSAQQVLEEEESLAGQYRGTPPLRTKKKKQPGQHRHSHEVADPEEVPPPLPPKRPSKEADDHAFLSGQTNQSLMESNIEPREISEDNLGSNEMLLYVGVEPNDKASQPPVASFRKKRPSPVGGPFQAHEEIEERPGSNQGIQSRPLPPPPAPTRSLKRGLKKRSPSPPVGAHLLVHSSSHSTTEQFHSVASTLDRTLVDSSVERRRATARRSSDDDTLADSIVDSMHSCADTLVGNGDDDATLHSCADTLHDSEDEEFFSEQFDLSGRHFRGADLPHDDDDTPTISTGAGDELSSRLRTETHELGRELLEHVENLRQTLDKMSHRLGKSPEPQGQ